MSYTDNRIISLSSASATKNNDTFLSNVSFHFTGLLKEDPHILHSSIQLIDAQIPVSFYTINATNNVLNYLVGINPFTITIPKGNYNGNSLIASMKSLFLMNTHIITPTISKITGILTFTALFNFTFVSTSSILKILGFLAIDNTSVSFILVAPYPLSLLGIKRISILSNHLATHAYSSIQNSTQNILGTIEIDAPSFGLVLYKNLSNKSSILKVKTVDRIDIIIQDEDGNLVDFNNIDWSLTLILSIEKVLVINTPQTFQQITQQQPQQQQPQQQNIIPETVPDLAVLGLPQTTDSDLDLMLYKSRQPTINK